jgi:endonuclease-3 related protein
MDDARRRAVTRQPTSTAATLRDVLRTLKRAYRDDVWHWMPDLARPIDVIAGAILVQHTTWTNAERALTALRVAGVLDVSTLVSMGDEEIASLVRVSGTPRMKARRLRATATTIEHAGGIDAFLALPLASMRQRLRATHGVGPETADAISLYAAGQRTFVIDAYTRRVFGRIGLEPDDGAGYDAWQAFFEDALPDHDAEAFQRYHGYIVLHAKALCRAVPRCTSCLLLSQCAYGRSTVGPPKPSGES